MSIPVPPEELVQRVSWIDDPDNPWDLGGPFVYLSAAWLRENWGRHFEILHLERFPPQPLPAQTAGAVVAAARLKGMARETSLPEFTAHNIELPDGTQTMPGQSLLRDWGICLAALRALKLFVPIEDPASPPRVADLGCLEGGYALEFARAGYEVLGIEGRRSNVDKCKLVADRFGLPNLSFVQDDARNLQSHGEFDAIFCCGLLYHLDQPVSFLHEMADVTRRLLILQTHYATADDEGWDRFQLSELTEHEGRLGRWYQEWEPDTAPEEVEKLSWSAVGNSASFWLEKRHLLQSIVDSGFPVVFEQYDFLEDIVANDYTEDQHRSLFLGVKGDFAPSVARKRKPRAAVPKLAPPPLTSSAQQAAELESELLGQQDRFLGLQEYTRGVESELRGAQRQVREVQHQLNSIRSTRLWRWGTRWWRLKARIRRRASLG